MLDHTNPSQHTLHRLQKFYTAGNSSILLDEANNALQEYPNSMVLINFISAALSQLGQYQEAISKLLEAIELNPDFPDSYNNLGTTYLKIGDVKSAIGMFKAAIDKNPEYAIAHRNLAKAYNENNEHIKAIRILKEALELEPNHPDTCNAMGQSYFLIRDFPLAIDYFMKAIKQNPSFFEAYNNLGSVFTELGNAESAAECFIHSLKLAPNYLDAKLNLTELLKTCKLTRYLENEIVVVEGVSNDEAYVVVEGSVRVTTYNHQQNPIVLELKGISSLVGEEACYSFNSAHRNTIRAAEKLKVVVIPGSFIRKLFRQRSNSSSFMSQDDRSEALRKLSNQSSIGKDIAELLQNESEIETKSLKPGEILFSEGDKAEFSCLILAGKIEALKWEGSFQKIVGSSGVGTFGRAWCPGKCSKSSNSARY